MLRYKIYRTDKLYEVWGSVEFSEASSLRLENSSWTNKNNILFCWSRSAVWSLCKYQRMNVKIVKELWIDNEEVRKLDEAV